MADTPTPHRPADLPTVQLPAAAEFAEPPTVDLRGRSTPPGLGLHAPLDDARVQAVQPFGDYELLGEIQRGGMGVVYRARERHSGRLVALKMMLDETVFGEADLRRFTLEARATAGLHHPGVVAIHAWGEHEGHPFYTMDFVSGVPLSRLLQDGPLPADRAVRYMIGIARAVAAAHAHGIVHRDLKPGNVMIDAADQPRVLDFGLAKRHRGDSAGEKAEEESLARSAGGGTTGNVTSPLHTLPRPGAPGTQRGAILGTPAYMAPEQARG